MKLVNGFKLVYEKGVGEDRKIYASKKSIPTTEDAATEPNIGSYPEAKLFYEKDNQIFVSNSNIPTKEDTSFTLTCDGKDVLGVADTPDEKPAPAPDGTEGKEAAAPKKTSHRKAEKESIAEEELTIPKEVVD